MKKAILTSVIILLVIQTSAQKHSFSFGVLLGANIKNIDNDYSGRNDPLFLKVPSYHTNEILPIYIAPPIGFSLLYQYRFNKTFALETGINTANRMIWFKSSCVDLNCKWVKTDIRFNYKYLPLTLNTRLPLKIKNLDIDIKTGGGFFFKNFLTDWSTNYTSHIKNQKDVSVNQVSAGEYKMFQLFDQGWSGYLNAGIDFTIGKAKRLKISANYIYEDVAASTLVLWDYDIKNNKRIVSSNPDMPFIYISPFTFQSIFITVNYVMFRDSNSSRDLKK